MKDILKKNYKNIIAFILGGLLLNKAVVYAVVLTSDNVSYDHSSSGLSATNLQSAIDEVYVKTDECVSKKVLTASFNANGATLSSTDTVSCTLEDNATSCNVEAPTITRSGYQIVGFNTSASSKSNNSAYNKSTGKLTLTESTTGKTWYAVTYKTGSTYTATFSANGNYSFGATISKTSASCTTTTAYNTSIPATSCTVELPTITPKSGYTAVGFGSGPGDSTQTNFEVAVGSPLTLTSSNTGNTWYAITLKTCCISAAEDVCKNSCGEYPSSHPCWSTCGSFNNGAPLGCQKGVDSYDKYNC